MEGWGRGEEEKCEEQQHVQERKPETQKEWQLREEDTQRELNAYE